MSAAERERTHEGETTPASKDISVTPALAHQAESQQTDTQTNTHTRTLALHLYHCCGGHGSTRKEAAEA